MPVCPICKGVLTCVQHGDQPIKDEDVTDPVLPCPQTCAIWVRVLDNGGRPVKGVKVEGAAKTALTNVKGFASFDALPPKKYTATISLPSEPEDLTKLYKLTDTTSRESTLSPGEVKFYNFKVQKKASPVIVAPEKVVVAVKGVRQKITLKADETFLGKGKLTCTNGGKIVRYYNAGKLVPEPAEFPGITEAGVEIEIEAHEWSELDGVELKWELEGDLSTGAVATKKVTVIAASLQIFDNAAGPLANDVGRVVHLQDAAKRYSRAKVVVKVDPAAYVGEVELSAAGDRLELYDDPDPKGAGNKAGLAGPIPVGPGKKTEFWAEGIKVSGAAKDVSLTLKIPVLAGEIDKAIFTVVETRLDLYAPRAKSDEEPKVIDADKKLDPGRTVVCQGPKLDIQRARISVHKTPANAPCKLILKFGAGKDNLKVYPQKGVNKAGKDHTYENSFDKETKLDLPYTLLDDAITDAKGAIFYVDGILKSAALEVKLQLEVEKVDAVADTAAFTVQNPSLKITVKRSDTLALVDDIEFSAKEAKGSAEAGKGTILKGTGVHTVELPVDNYLIALKPKNPAELGMRVVRTNPDTSDSAVSVKGVSEVEFELRPAYKKVQFIAYWIQTGKYIGTDTRLVELELDSVTKPAKDWTITQGAVTGKVDKWISNAANVHKLSVAMSGLENLAAGAATVTEPPATNHPGCRIVTIDVTARDKWLDASRTDLAGRCALMTDAIVKANSNPSKAKIEAGKDVLKVFMAPEFYFRGVQGAYPFECIGEILQDAGLKAEIAKSPDYDDWLFVLGSGIGAIDGKARVDHAGARITDTNLTPAVVTINVETGKPGAGVAVDWKLWIAEPNGDWTPRPGVSEFKITNVIANYTNGGFENKTLELDGTPVFDHSRAVTVFEDWAPFEVTLSYPGKVVGLVLDSVDLPDVGWIIEKGLFSGDVSDVIGSAGNKRTLEVTLASDENLIVGAVTVTEPPATDHPGCNLDAVQATFVYLDCPGLTSGVASGWRLRISNTTGTAWPSDAQHDFEIEDVDDYGGDKRRITVLAEFDFVAGQKFAVWGNPNEISLAERTKMVWTKVDTGGFVPAVGWGLAQGSIKGAVVQVNAIAGNEYYVKAAIPTDKTLVNGPIALSEPGEVEIVNVALVAKGGKGAPVSAEGRTAKELMVYKEKISSVDFQTFDYGGQLFYGDVRHMIEVHGDGVVRALPTVGSTDRLATAPQKSGLVVNGRRISEQSITGLGGGCVFTMDGITFGLEVCLDHGAKRLDNYYKTDAQPGEPKVQVQLLPSCGQGLQFYYAVADGLAFNVDATHVATKKDNGATNIVLLANTQITPAEANKYFEVADTPKSGRIIVYTAENTPTKGVV